MTYILFFFLLGCASSWLVIQVLLSCGVGQSGEAAPQHHHTHTGIIPRIGGVGIISGFGLTYLLCFLLLDEGDNQSLMHYAVFGGAAGAFLMGFVDDFKPLGAKVKLLAQVIIALLAHHCGLSIERVGIPFTDILLETQMLSVPLTVLWFVAIMNLINLIDGLDGLAGGIGIMLMLLLAYLGYEKGVAFSLILSLGMIGAIFGFLFHNFPPARVYMGDSGAYAIGYVIAALSLLNSEKGAVVAALLAPTLALALPIIDVSFAMLRRGLRGLPLFRPDQGHIHHRLIRSGFSRRKTVLVLYGCTLVAVVGGLMLYAERGRYLPIFLGFTFVIVLYVLRGQNVSAASIQGFFADSVQARQDTRNALNLRDWFVLEAARADCGQHLWSDYHFILKKMGFCRAELKVNGEARSFFLPGAAAPESDELWCATVVLHAADDAELTLYAEKANFSESQIALVMDLAAEAWVKAAAKWKALYGTPLSFDVAAKEPEDYRAQKVRNLYRPTY